jgi:hypothetical protein
VEVEVPYEVKNKRKNKSDNFGGLYLIVLVIVQLQFTVSCTGCG